MCAPLLEITHQDAPTFFTTNNFIFSQRCNALELNGVNRKMAPFALVTNKGGSTCSII
jgi:hypothetical protein